MTKKISLIIPVYNEATNIHKNLQAIASIIDKTTYNFEFIIVDDGSSDQTVNIIRSLSKKDSRFCIIELARNFGKEAAIYAGLSEANGDASIIMDSDLQHPPEMIPKMIENWSKGYKVVEALKEERNDSSIASMLFARCFYYLYKKLSGFDISNYCDFKLLDQSIVKQYLSMPERIRFFRGLVKWMGVRSKVITFQVAPRSGGSSAWSKLTLFRYAINNITSFSNYPIYIITYIGITIVGMGFIVGLWSLYQKATGKSLDGFTTVNLLIITIGGGIITSIGIIGHYIGRLFIEVKGRPIYIKADENNSKEGK